MKVQMIAQISGTRNGQDWPKPGELIDLPDDEATQMLANRLVRMPVEEETADAPQAKVEKRPRKGLTTKDV